MEKQRIGCWYLEEEESKIPVGYELDCVFEKANCYTLQKLLS